MMWMRGFVAALAVLACAPAGAGTYTIDFSSLAADAGQTVTTSFDDDGFRVYVNAVRVVGPGVPYYSGSIGIVATADQYDVVIDPDLPRSVVLDSISGTFAAEVGRAYTWNGVADVDQRGPSWTWTGSAPATSTFTPGVPTAIDRVWLTQISGTAAQMTGITIDAVLGPAVPEPPGLILLGIGMWLGPMLARRRIDGVWP